MAKLSIFAPREQQLKGLKTVLDKISFGAFVNAVNVLAYHRVISRSRRGHLIKDARHICGIPYGGPHQ